MKRFILNLLCIVTFLLWNSSLFAGTTKLSADSVINFLIGKWNWTSTNGGVLGVIIGPSSVNYTKSIVCRYKSGRHRGDRRRHRR